MDLAAVARKHRRPTVVRRHLARLGVSGWLVAAGLVAAPACRTRGDGDGAGQAVEMDREAMAAPAGPRGAASRATQAETDRSPPPPNVDVSNAAAADIFDLAVWNAGVVPSTGEGPWSAEPAAAGPAPLGARGGAGVDDPADDEVLQHLDDFAGRAFDPSPERGDGGKVELDDDGDDDVGDEGVDDPADASEGRTVDPTAYGVARDEADPGAGADAQVAAAAAFEDTAARPSADPAEATAGNGTRATSDGSVRGPDAAAAGLPALAQRVGPRYFDNVDHAGKPALLACVHAAAYFPALLRRYDALGRCAFEETRQAQRQHGPNVAADCRAPTFVGCRALDGVERFYYVYDLELYPTAQDDGAFDGPCDGPASTADDGDGAPGAQEAEPRREAEPTAQGTGGAQ